MAPINAKQKCMRSFAGRYPSYGPQWTGSVCPPTVLTQACASVTKDKPDPFKYALGQITLIFIIAYETEKELRSRKALKSYGLPTVHNGSDNSDANTHAIQRISDGGSCTALEAVLGSL